MAGPCRIKVDVPAVSFEVPEGTDILHVPRPLSALTDPFSAVARALAAPIGTVPLAEVIRTACPDKAPGQRTAVVVVSDQTRPEVPYTGEASILHPVLRTLEAQGLRRQNIVVLVATGTHRATTEEEKRHLYGDDVYTRYPIIDHNATDRAFLRLVATTASGTDVLINQRYLDADIKILTGEIKPHFMAGFSGGRKAICPGLANLETLQKFHSPQFLEDPGATNLSLDANPCHREAMEVAQRVGADFLINVTMNEEKELTGVYAGDWRLAFERATESLAEAVSVPVSEPYELLITIDSTIDHYQAAKAAIGALPILVDGGTLIQVANSSDGVGAQEYAHELALLSSLPRPRDYIEALFRRPSVQKDQWEVEMWCKVLEKVGGPSGLVYCTNGINPGDLEKLPLTSGYAYSGESVLGPMVEKSIGRTTAAWQKRLGRLPRLGLIRDGAHAIPFLRAPQ